MIGWEKRVLLRHFLEQGMTKAAVAKQLGVSRRTVHYWIETEQLDRDVSNESVHYGPRPSVPTKLDAYKGIIVSRLAEYPDLTAMRLFAEIKASGYAGCYTQVKEYVRKVRPRAPEEPVVRFETPPAHQGQVDFADFRLPWGKRYALLVVLGYSRVLWMQFFTRQTMPHVFEGLEAAFSFFGGVPHELLFDQMKAVITKDERGAGGRVTENAEFLRFAHHWDFRHGRTFTSDEDLNHQARHWLDHVANVRTHGTLKERPVDRFERERDLLGPLASRPYRSFVLPPEVSKQARAVLPRIDVERRSLEAYAQVAGGVR